MPAGREPRHLTASEVMPLSSEPMRGMRTTVQQFPFFANEVGTRLPNPWFFYDMHGSVQEYCRDTYVSNLGDQLCHGSIQG